MRNFEHQNVLRMKGVVIKDNLPLVVMPYMAKGDLKGYISNTELVSGAAPDNYISPFFLYKFNFSRICFYLHLVTFMTVDRFIRFG